MSRFFLFVLLFLSGEFLHAKLPDLIPYRKGDLWGYCDSTKKIIIPCRFEYVALFSGDSARGVFESQNGYILKNGDFHADPPPPKILDYSVYYPWPITIVPYPTVSYVWVDSKYKCKGLFPYTDSITNLIGFKNCEGKLVIPCKYFNTGSFSDGLCFVILSDSVLGYINEKGKVELKFTHDYGLNDFTYGNAIISFNGKQGIINKRGEFIIPPTCDQIIAHEHFFQIENYNSGNHFVFNSKGKWIDQRAFDQFEECENGFSLVSCQGHFGFLDTYGKEIVPIKYTEAIPFKDGFAGVANDSAYWGFVNEKGKLVIPMKYSTVEPFENGHSNVSNSEGLHGLINTSGKQITPIKYVEIQTFQNGLAIVNDNNGLWGFINEKGQEIIELKYFEVYSFRNGLSAVRDNTDSWGFIDTTGKLVIPCKYWMPANIGFNENGLCEINKTGFIDIHGTEYWED